MDSYELNNGHTVTVGDEYVMDYDNTQLGVPQGTEMTVYKIGSTMPGNTAIFFHCDFSDGTEPMDEYEEPVTIVAEAMSKLLDDDSMKSAD